MTLDIEAFPDNSRGDYKQLVKELYGDLQSRGLKLYIAVPVNDRQFDYAGIARLSDGLILMNYDEHYPGGQPGAIASPDWFINNLEEALAVMPREKIIAALEAEEAETDVNFDDDAMNPHIAYLDDNNIRHDVWFLDGVTALNQMRAAQSIGIDTFALWRLGSEDRSLWAIWDKPGEAGATAKLKVVPPGQDVDIEGDGEILHIQSRPAAGERQVTVDPQSNLINDEIFKTMPSPYTVDMYGNSLKKVAITFDDGPDPQWTPKILDILKEKNVKATFFLIGVEAEKHAGLTKRIYNEGHEIGNHTFTHPDISNVSKV